MLIPRVMPCLLIDHGKFVKTTRFKDPTYVGDPVNVINLFNRFEVDEIVLLDIRATVRQQPPDFDLIQTLATECWVPLAYGGHVASMADARRIFSLGVEKIILNTVLADQPSLITKLAEQFGNQAVSISVDVKKPRWGKPEAWVASGSRRLKRSPVEAAQYAESLGAGEILLHHIDREGLMGGYDLTLIREVAASVSIPVVACGGAGSRADLARPIHEANASAVAAGSLFVFQNTERGILINFPERDALEALLQQPSSSTNASIEA